MIEFLAAAIVVMAFACVLFRSLRLHRFKVQSRGYLRKNRVRLATIVMEVFPEVNLHARDVEHTRNSGHQDPPWTHWMEREKLSRPAIITEPEESGWLGARTLHALYRIDCHVFESFSELMHRRINAFSDLRRPFQWWKNPKGDKKEVDVYDRQFAERILEEHLTAYRHDVVISKDSHRGGYKLAVDEKSFQIKDPLCFDFQRHLHEYPGIGLITSDDFFRFEDDPFTLDPSPGTHRLSILSGAGLDRLFAADQAVAQDTMGMQAHAVTAASAGSADYQNPFLTLGLSSLREIRLLVKRHTDLKTAARNLGLDVAGTGVGSFAGAKAGATIGTALAPGVGSVVGAIIGSIGGGFAGRSITNKLKFAKAEAARSHYEEKMRRFQQRLEEVTIASREAVESTVRKEQAALHQLGMKRTKQLDALTSRLESRSKVAYLLPRVELGDFFSRCEIDLRTEEKNLKATLRDLSFWDRILWPNEEAVRLKLHRSLVRRHLAELSRARTGVLDPACSLSDVEKTSLCLELFAAFSGLEEEIRRHLAQYKATAEENVATLAAWPPDAIRELAKRRMIALKRISDKANALRLRTGEQLKSDVRKAKRAQNRFARELRKLGLAT